MVSIGVREGGGWLKPVSAKTWPYWLTVGHKLSISGGTDFSLCTWTISSPVSHIRTHEYDSPGF